MSTVIKVENLSKQYQLGQVGTGTMANDVNRWWHRVRGKEDPYLKIGDENDRTKKATSEFVWALKDINPNCKNILQISPFLFIVIYIYTALKDLQNSLTF